MFLSSLRGWTRIDLFELCHICMYIRKSQLRIVSESLALLAQLKAPFIWSQGQMNKNDHLNVFSRAHYLPSWEWNGKVEWKNNKSITFTSTLQRIIAARDWVAALKSGYQRQWAGRLLYTMAAHQAYTIHKDFNNLVQDINAWNSDESQDNTLAS